MKKLICNSLFSLFVIMFLVGCGSRIKPGIDFAKAKPQSVTVYTLSTNFTADKKADYVFTPVQKAILRELKMKGYQSSFGRRIRSTELTGQSWIDYRPGRRKYVAEQLSRVLVKEAKDKKNSIDSIILTCVWDQRSEGKNKNQFVRTEVWWWSVASERFIHVDYAVQKYGRIKRQKSELIKTKTHRLPNKKIKTTKTYQKQSWWETITFDEAAIKSVQKMSLNFMPCK
jgi:hypothetical protein